MYTCMVALAYFDMILEANNPFFEAEVLLENRIERKKERMCSVKERRRIFINFLSLVVQDRGPLYRPVS